MINSSSDYELELVKQKPRSNINLNSHGDLTFREKAVLVVTSKPFVITATVLTLGLYYVYYVFCIEQCSDNYFTNPNKKFTPYKKKLIEQDWFHESLSLDDRLTQKINPIEPRFVNRRVRACIVRFYKRFLVVVSSIFGHVVTVCFRVVGTIRGRNIRQSSIADVRAGFAEDERKEIKHAEDNFNDAVKHENLKGVGEFDLGDTIRILMHEDSDYAGRQKTHEWFFPFLYTSSYILLSIVTLGIFPIYHLCRHFLNEKEFSFFGTSRVKENSDLIEFNSRIDRLTNRLESRLEYSVVLLNSINLEFPQKPLSKVFRTECFRDLEWRNLTLWSLNILSGGIFGLGILLRSLKIREHSKSVMEGIQYRDTIGHDYSDYFSWSDRVRLFRQDFTRDLRLAMEIAAEKESKISRSLVSLTYTDDRILASFLRVVSSGLFRASFVFVTLFLTVAIIVVFSLLPYSWVMSTVFWSWFVFYLILLLSLSKHISLLFL